MLLLQPQSSRSSCSMLQSMTVEQGVFAPCFRLGPRHFVHFTPPLLPTQLSVYIPTSRPSKEAPAARPAQANHRLDRILAATPASLDTMSRLQKSAEAMRQCGAAPSVLRLAQCRRIFLAQWKFAPVASTGRRRRFGGCHLPTCSRSPAVPTVPHSAVQRHVVATGQIQKMSKPVCLIRETTSRGLSYKPSSGLHGVGIGQHHHIWIYSG